MRPKLLLVLAAVLVAPAVARAVTGTCEPVAIKTTGGAAFTNVDISGGAVTTGILPVSWAANLLLRPSVTDADNTVTNVRFTLREYESNAAAAQARTVIDCDKAAGVWTCNRLAIDWNPTTAGNGKHWTVPIPLAYKYVDVTATPTGHGAGDTLSLTNAELCY